MSICVNLWLTTLKFFCNEMIMNKKGFLDIVKKERGNGNYSGDEFGGGRGTDGSGMPTGKPGNFMFATGIECSYRPSVRLTL